MGRITKLFILFVISYLLLVVVPKAQADVSCQPIYGGGQSCVTLGNVAINKKVLNPSTNTFADNLGINDPKYQPGFIVNFRLDVTNTGNTTINKVDVKDIFPKPVDFSSGPGNFDQNARTLSFTMQNLAPGETRQFVVIGRVAASNQLPSGNEIVCAVNQAIAVTDNNGNSQDNAQLCIENKIPVVITKGGFPVFSPSAITSTPSTGPEALALFSLIPAGITGWLLKRWSIKNEAEGGEIKNGIKRIS